MLNFHWEKFEFRFSASENQITLGVDGQKCGVDDAVCAISSEEK